VVAAASDLGACVCEDDATVSELDDLRARVRGQAEQIAALQDALRQVLDCRGSYNGTVSMYGGDPAICTKCEAVARDALALAKGCAAPADDVTTVRWKGGMTPRWELLVPWTLSIGQPGVVFAEGEDGLTKAIATFENHVLAADAVCAHNAVLAVRPHGTTLPAPADEEEK